MKKKPQEKQGILENLFKSFIKSRLMKVLLLEESLEDCLESYTCCIDSDFRLNSLSRDVALPRDSVRDSRCQSIANQDALSGDSSVSGFSSLGSFKDFESIGECRVHEDPPGQRVNLVESIRHPVIIKSHRDGRVFRSVEELRDYRQVNGFGGQWRLNRKRREMLEYYIRRLNRCEFFNFLPTRDLGTIILQVIRKKRVVTGSVRGSSLTLKSPIFEFIVTDSQKMVKLVVLDETIQSGGEAQGTLSDLQRGDILLCQDVRFKFEAVFQRRGPHRVELAEVSPVIFCGKCVLLCPSLKSVSPIWNNGQLTDFGESHSANLDQAIRAKTEAQLSRRVSALFQKWAANKMNQDAGQSEADFKAKVLGDEKMHVQVEVSDIFQKLEGTRETPAQSKGDMTIKVELNNCESKKSESKSNRATTGRSSRKRKPTQPQSKAESTKKRRRPRGSAKKKKPKSTSNHTIFSFFKIKPSSIAKENSEEVKSTQKESEEQVMPDSGSGQVPEEFVSFIKSETLPDAPSQVLDCVESDTDEKPEESGIKIERESQTQPRTVRPAKVFGDVLDFNDVLDVVKVADQDSREDVQEPNGSVSELTDFETEAGPENPCQTLNSNLVQMKCPTPTESLGKRSLRTKKTKKIHKKQKRPERAARNNKKVRTRLTTWIKKNKDSTEQSQPDLRVNALELESLLASQKPQVKESTGENVKMDQQATVEQNDFLLNEREVESASNLVPKPLEFEMSTIYNFVRLNQTVLRSFLSGTS